MRERDRGKIEEGIVGGMEGLEVGKEEGTPWW
jgi:hypothetical protein